MPAKWMDGRRGLPVRPAGRISAPVLHSGRSARAPTHCQVTITPFVRLNVALVQNAAALRYQAW
jgi:hypothetical protein